MFSTLSAQIGAVLTLGVCLFAASSRRKPQVLAALAVAIAWIASAALQNRVHGGDPQYAIFALDALAAVVFSGMALRYREGWLIWVAAFQLLTAATHIGMIVDKRIFVRAYFTAYLVWSYLLVASVAWGGWAGWRARRRDRVVG